MKVKEAVIKIEDVLEDLKNGKIGALGMDVYENEKGVFLVIILLTFLMINY
jgi:lactate dehydrogenase-like 2-hydroxyacid dehydrogenase